eukprot:GFKZ01001366.1.p2 GENE.GFKZ01001366.1~~GFKZ01001366.1.p2  ORF type:complete len:252 (-),score=39.24 GFKZ01001366.1:710-1381(-)
MADFMRRTLLLRRISEVFEAHRALRRSQHRASIRIKRAAVQARLNQELQQLRIERITLELERARATARIQGLSRIAQQRMKRDTLIREKLAEHGHSVPRKEVGFGAENEADVRFKRGVVQRVEDLIGETDEVPVGRRVANGILKDTVAEVNLQGLQDDTDRGLKMVAAVAKSAGVDWKHMQHLVELVEPDVSKRRRLALAIRHAMENEGTETANETRVVDGSR